MLRRVHETIVAAVNQVILHILSVRACVRACVAFLTQRAELMRHIIFSSVACLAFPYFSSLSHKRHDFQKVLFYIKCVFIFSITFI